MPRERLSPQQWARLELELKKRPLAHGCRQNGTSAISSPSGARVACGAGSQGFHARSCCSRSARSAAMARAVWLFTAPRLMPIAAATSASEKSA